MGKGDKKTAKGKRTIGSYGNTRKRKVEKTAIVASNPKKVKATETKETTKKPAAKKAASKKAESSDK
jgi:ribosomal small subunit protein bTHX